MNFDLQLMLDYFRPLFLSLHESWISKEQKARWVGRPYYRKLKGDVLNEASKKSCKSSFLSYAHS